MINLLANRVILLCLTVFFAASKCENTASFKTRVSPPLLNPRNDSGGSHGGGATSIHKGPSQGDYSEQSLEDILHRLGGEEQVPNELNSDAMDDAQFEAFLARMEREERRRNGERVPSPPPFAPPQQPRPMQPPPASVKISERPSREGYLGTEANALIHAWKLRRESPGRQWLYAFNFCYKGEREKEHHTNSLARDVRAYVIQMEPRGGENDDDWVYFKRGNAGNGHKGLVQRIREEAAAHSIGLAVDTQTNTVSVPVEASTRFSKALQDDLAYYTGNYNYIRLHQEEGIPADFNERTFSQEEKAKIDRIRLRIGNEIKRLNGSGYYTNPNRPQVGIVNVNDVPYDRNALIQVLESIRVGDEEAFYKAMIDFVTCFPRTSAEAKAAFIDSFSTLFVTMMFPSVGIRQDYYHYILHCGQIYSG